MRPCQTTLCLIFRSLAALTLMVFVVAQATCFAHCHLGSGHGEKAQPSCHSSPQATAPHDRNDNHDGPPLSPPAATTICSTLKTMLAAGDALTLVAPRLYTVYLLTPISLVLDAPATQMELPFSRQAGRGDWIFTPEVCLGSALHSLAPPFVR